MTRLLITGAASGIGKACVEHFDSKGAELILVDRAAVEPGNFIGIF